MTPCPVTSTAPVASTVTVTSASATTQATTTPVEVTVTPDHATTTTTVTTFTATSTLRATPVAQKFRRTYPSPPTCPKSSSPSKVPDFACNVCKTPSAFTTACKCLGIKPSTTTLPASTVYTTVTTTQTVAEISLTTIVSTSTSLTTVTATTSTTTVTSTVSTETTVLPSPTSCFLLLPKPQEADRYLDLLDNDQIAFRLSSASAFSLTDGDTGYLYDYFRRRPVGGVPPTPDEYPNDSIRFMRGVDINDPLARSVECVRANDALTCNTGVFAQTRFVQCGTPGRLRDRSELLLLRVGFPMPDGCQVITLSTQSTSCPG